MDQRKRRKYGKKKRNPIERFFYKIRKSLKELTSLGNTEPKEYRPYLGPQSKSEQPEGQKKYKKSRKKHKRPIGQKSGFHIPLFSNFSETWEKRKKKRRKKKYIKRKQKKHQAEFKKRARIDFIRRFYPQYKKPRNVPLVELSKEEAAEAIKHQQKNYFYYTINSVALFVIAYLLVYMFYQLTVLVSASRWKLDSVLFYYDLAFNDYSPLWSRYNIIMVTFSGPLVSLLLGILFYRIIASRRKVKGFLKLFVMWIALHAFNMFFGAFASGVSFDQGFGYVPAWLYWNVFWQIFVSLLFLFILGLIGYYSASKFLDTSNSAYRIREENKLKFLLYQVVLPWLVGSLIIFLVKIPNNMPYETATLFTMMVGVVPVLLNKHARPTVNFNRERKPTRIKWIFIVLFVILLLAYRIGLNNGLHVILNYKFIFTLDVTPL